MIINMFRLGLYATFFDIPNKMLNCVSWVDPRRPLRAIGRPDHR